MGALADRYIVVDITEPDFPRFLGCALRFMRDAHRITFCTQEDWDRFQREQANTFMPWVYMEPDLRAAVESQGTVVGVLASSTSGIEVDVNAERMLPGLMRITYRPQLSRAFDSRVAALQECGTNNDWWEDVVREVWINGHG